MKKVLDFSIIIPCLNSENTVEKSLQSIFTQDYDLSKIEVLVLDGGSTDSTKEIASRYGCKIINNPKVQQEYGKHLGLLKSKANYVIFLDSDEVFDSNQALNRRMYTFKSDPSIKFVHSGGYVKPNNYSNINDYINYFSDPFAFFMNGTSTEKSLFIGSWKHSFNDFVENDIYVKFNYTSQTPLLNVDMCAGNTIDRKFLFDISGKNIANPIMITGVFYSIVRKTGVSAIVKNDGIIHYSADTFVKFLNKLNWRVIVNVHYKNIAGTGYSNREQFQPVSYRLKKYLFLPYSFSIILPLFVSIYYFFKFRKSIALVHSLLTVYVGVCILKQYVLKLLGIKPPLKSYGKQEIDLSL